MLTGDKGWTIIPGGFIVVGEFKRPKIKTFNSHNHKKYELNKFTALINV